MSDGIGDSVDDLKWNYSIDMIYMLYEKGAKRRLDERRDLAITMANSFIFASPSYDKKDSAKKARFWRRFLDRLDWNKLKQARKPADMKKTKAFFRSIGIPIVGEEKDVKK